MLHDFFFFVRQAARAPGSIGAIAPSSRALGRLMAAGLGANSGQVVEIGAGTGSLTRAILGAGVAEENLVLVEMNRDFCTRLRARFPKARVINAGAQEMPALGLADIGTVISGLPLLNFPIPLQREIISAVFDILSPAGNLVQFTYGARPPIAPEVRQALALDWQRRGKVWANLPPATVYRFHRPAGH